MKRYIGTNVMGLRCPIIKAGDDIVDIAVDTILKASEAGNFKINDRDVVGLTESIVAKSMNNFATVDDITHDVKNKFNCDEVALIHPIMSRNRFAICLKGIAKAFKKVYVLFSYPHDEVGNHLCDPDELDNFDINPYGEIVEEKEFKKCFPNTKHIFTNVDYIEYYKEIIEEAGAEAVMLFGNNEKNVLKYTKNILVCSIHTRVRTKEKLKKAGAEKIFCLSEILDTSIDGSGFNEKYGLLGSNKSTENKIKLFPRDCEKIVYAIQDKILEKIGKKIEVLVYGDGAFKDPVGKIWELADPVVSPAFTDGLKGTPNEIKLKYIADNSFAELKGEELEEAIKEKIHNKDSNLVGSMESQGTTPRQLTDLIGSLCDLTSGSGDKGTPVVYIKGYFDNFSEE